MTTLPPDHPDRRHLADEVHARPPEALTTPTRATHVAVLVEVGSRAAEYEHLAELCARFGVEPPDAGAIHFAADLGPVRVRWERHGEFSSYTFFRAGRSPTPFSEPPVDLLPAGWLAEVPGRTIFAAHAKIIPGDAEDPTPDFLAAHFDGNTVVGSAVGDGAALAFTDFRQRADGFSRFLILDRALTPRQAGRTLQRLLEIETYRMMAMLALPLAREQSRTVVTVEQALAVLTADIAQGTQADEALLGPRTRVVALTHMSNVTGAVSDVPRIVAGARRVGAMVLLDGCQSVVHQSIDVAALDCDFFVFSSHKLYGPTGFGILYGKADRLAEMAPYQGGGEMIGIVSMDRITYADPPHRFEAGTPPILEAIGFGAAVRWLEGVDRPAAAAHEHALYARAVEGLRDLNGLRILGTTPDKGAILTFTLEGAHAHDVAQILDRYGVAVRAGTHCAEPLMRRFGVGSSARASFALYNTPEEADAFVDALHRASSFFA